MKIKLLEGEVLCPKCKGSTLVKGELKKYPKTGWRRQLIACPFCFATGKMDWVDAIKGQAHKSKAPYPEYHIGYYERWKDMYEDGIKQMEDKEETIKKLMKQESWRYDR